MCFNFISLKEYKNQNYASSRDPLFVEVHAENRQAMILARKLSRCRFLISGVFQIFTEEKEASLDKKKESQGRKSSIYNQAHSLPTSEASSRLHQPQEWWEPRGQTHAQVLLVVEPTAGVRLVPWRASTRVCY